MKAIGILILLFISSKVGAQEVFANPNARPTIGDTIVGDFDGDGKLDTAFWIRTKIGSDTDWMDDPDEHEIHFSNPKFEAIKGAERPPVLLNEGMLLNNGKDIISIFQPPMNGCHWYVSTYVFMSGKWKLVIEPFLMMTECEEVTANDLKKRIFRANGVIYFLDDDNPTQKAIRRKAKLLVKVK
jgi:hypothetical protein